MTTWASRRRELQEKRRPDRSRPSTPPGITGLLLSLVILFILVSVVLTVEGWARPVSMSQAISRYLRPRGRSGHPPASGCVLVSGLGHRQTEPPAPLPVRGADTAGNRRSPKRRVLELPHRLLHKPLAELDLLRTPHRPRGDRWTGLAALDGRARGRDQPVDVAVFAGVAEHPHFGARSGQGPGPPFAQARRRKIHGTLVTAGAIRFVGQPNLTIAGHKIPAVHIEVQWRLSGPQVGTERDDLWFDAQSGLPLQNRRTIQVRTRTPFGPSTYTENGEFVLRSLTPKT
jgi:hypothetical protein